MSTSEQPGTPLAGDGSPLPGPGPLPSVRSADFPPPRRTAPATADDAHGQTAAIGRLAATVERLRREVRSAHAAADGRALVELAKGVLVERLRCAPAEAARQLQDLAEQAGVTHLELAAEVINQAARDRVAEVADDFVRRTGAAAGTGAPPDHDGPSAAVRLRTAESGALAADDTQAVAESLLEHALAPLGAHAVAVWLAGSDASLTLAGHAGFGTGEAERWRYVPPGVATVARRALTDRHTVSVRSLARDGLPSIGRLEHPDSGRLAIPAGTGGRIHGVLEICWPHALEPQPPQIMRQIETLAELCAHTLEKVPGAAARPPLAVVGRLPHVSELVELSEGVHDSALVLLPHLDADGHLTDFRIHHANSRFIDPTGRPRGAVSGALLLEAYPMTAGDSDLFGRVQRVYATGEAFRARRMTLTTLVEQVPFTAVADVSITRHGSAVLLIWRVEDETARFASLLQHAQRLGRIGGFEENLLTGDIVWNRQLFELRGLPPTAPPVPLEDLPAHAHPDDAVAIGRFLRTVLHHRRHASIAFRLQRSDGVTRHIRVVAEPVLGADGRLLAVRGAYQDISSQHWTEVALAATRDRLAQTEQQAVERNRLTLQLQHAIMPPTRAPLAAPGLEVAVRYRPAETESLVGGDWYDMVVLPSKDVLLCVGDVAGHGIEAATSMVVLRNALRGLAVTGAGPGQLLSWLNIVAHHLTDRVTATVVCGVFDPRTRTLRWARAGHLPPVLVRGDEARTLPPVGGVLLGALSNAEYAEEEIQLDRGDTLLMYTDGLVERKDLSVPDALAQLVNTARTPAASLEHRLDRLLTHSRSDTDDDTCLIGMRVE
ncbi:SpoIIE family protein phosphatase [Streptomyces sp. NPDC006368]|uniref:SpoIIE family protein phosphatase n=1 Tax=Streptomyces sp. NPDC006368 TaxID=3156760 RepID=UPI0033A35211